MPVPDLEWVTGTVTQILVQDKEEFYVVTVANRALRFGDPYTGNHIRVTADNPAFHLLMEAFFRGSAVEVGVRNFGHDPQSGIDKVVIDRVSLRH